MELESPVHNRPLGSVTVGNVGLGCMNL